MIVANKMYLNQKPNIFHVTLDYYVLRVHALVNVDHRSIFFIPLHVSCLVEELSSVASKQRREEELINLPTLFSK